MLLRLLFLLLPLLVHGGQDPLFPEEDPHICHNVNVITGHLDLSFIDDSVAGPVALKLLRTYTSAGALERTKNNMDQTRHKLKGAWTLQGGWHFFPQIHLILDLPKIRRNTTASLTEASGASSYYTPSA
jgi:hypothetical protein